MTLLLCPGKDKMEGYGPPWDKWSNQNSKVIVTVFVHNKHECVVPVVYSLQTIPESGGIAWVGRENFTRLFWVVLDDANIRGVKVKLFWESRCPGQHENTVVTWGEIVVSTIVELLELRLEG